MRRSKKTEERKTGKVYGTCAMCRFENVRGKYLKDYTSSVPLVLCDVCSRKYVFSPLNHTIRARSNRSKYKNQQRLYRNVVKVIMGRGGARSQVHSEMGFLDWGLSIKSGFYRYDIGVPRYRLLVEYNGKQHYEEVDYYPDADLAEIQERDRIKREVARENGYNLAVFAYNEPVDSLRYVELKLKPYLDSVSYR